MDAAHIVLIITCVLFAILIVIASIYFLIYFQHPDDKWVAWFPKVLVVSNFVHANLPVERKSY